jgi:hypothetical protein
MKLMLLFCFISLQICAFAQTDDKGNKKAQYAHYPMWVAMMRDSAVNFQETELAFGTYYKDEQPPIHLKTENIDSLNDIIPTATPAAKRQLFLQIQRIKFQHWYLLAKPAADSIYRAKKIKPLLRNSRFWTNDAVLADPVGGDLSDYARYKSAFDSFILHNGALPPVPALPNITVSPNPAHHNFTLEGKGFKGSFADVTIVNSRGIKLWTKVMNLNSGIMNSSFSVTQLPPGEYRLIIKLADNRKVEKPLTIN